HLGSALVRALRKGFLYPGDYESPAYQAILQETFAGTGKHLRPAVRRAIVDFSERFYRKVFPTDPKDADRSVDFSDSKFLRDYVHATSTITRARRIQTNYIFMGRA